VALGVWRPPAPVDVDRLTEVQDRRVCAVIETLAALAFAGVPPPSGGTTEEISAVQQVNAQLAQRRETIMGMTAVREMGC
jgi:hypothetical protein